MAGMKIYIGFEAGLLIKKSQWPSSRRRPYSMRAPEELTHECTYSRGGSLCDDEA